MNNVPIYMFTGFLESGKSTFLLDVLEGQRFTEGLKALVIACEQGEVEFNERRLKMKDIDVVYIEDQEDFSTETLAKLNEQYQPEIVMIEFNGMWLLNETLANVHFPEMWVLAQVVTTIDASTFESYLMNMRSIIYEAVVNADMVIFNRCDDQTKKSYLRSNIRAINRMAQIIYETVDGKVNTLPEDAMPFDLTQALIEIKDEDYGLWYMDALEHPDKYAGKKVKVRGKAYEPMDDAIHDCAFVLARQAMVCCADDLQPIGFLCYFEFANQLAPEEWLEIEATMDHVFDDDFEQEVPVMKVEHLKVIPPMEDDLVYFG